MNMTDQITGHENAGHENAGQKMQRQELPVMDSRQLIYVNYVQISPPKRDNIEKRQSHVRHTLSTLYLKSFNVQQTIVCKFT